MSVETVNRPPAESKAVAKRKVSTNSEKGAKKRVKKEPSAPKTKQVRSKQADKVKKENEEEIKQEIEDSLNDSKNEDGEDEHKWWEQGVEDNTIKWETLEHNGVLFPPPYEPLPSHVRLVYDKKPVVLPLEAEEVAGFFGAMLTSGEHCQNPVFQQNFFQDFLKVLKDAGGAKDLQGNPVKLTDFNKCNFTAIHQYYEAQREAKKALSSAEKKRIKQEKDEAEERFKTCMFNGRKEDVGNFRIEPPGLFRGRGKHPKTGKLKARVQPEQVTINIGEGCPVPKAPEGHEWAEVRHDKTVSWLATWKENINGNTKYVFLAQNSSIKGMSDLRKFEKARELKNHVDAIRADYRKEMTDDVMANRQRATAMYLIDVLALRAGGEKSEDEADTVGCCSLRYEHVTLEPPNFVTFDFLGKDSIRYFQKVEVDKQVFTNLRIFKKAPKREGDDIFDRLDPSILNRHLQSYMPGLTAKVFRTYNASFTMQNLLNKIPNTGTVGEKMLRYNAANREVAILCNHQRTVAKGHDASVAKVTERIEELQWQKIRVLSMLLQVDPNRKKDKKIPKKFWDDLKAFTKTKRKQITKRIIAKEREKVEKKHKRQVEKAASQKEAGETVDEPSDLKEMLNAVDALEGDYLKEIASDTYEIKASQTADKLLAQAEKLDERIANTQVGLQDKQENSTVSLGTSKMNYIDPRLTVTFSKKFNVPIEKLFTKTLRNKFEWAIKSADENWQF